jgi:hypothetical protein
MMPWLESTALATWVRESASVWAYPTVLTLHTVGLGVVVGASAVIDFRLLGFARRVPMPALLPLFGMIWWAFALNASSGLLLFIADATRKSAQPVFCVKLALIALALINMLLVKRLITRDDGGSEATPTRHKRLAAASLLLWAASITAGRLMAYM